MWWLIPIGIILFLMVHAFKMIRLYLVLMEHKIGLFKFILLYTKTTFVNLAIPFKLGEVYRIFAIARETRVWQVGVLSIIIDRFFDIVALFLVLLPFDIFLRRKLSIITGVFFVCITVIIVISLSILPTYRYLNKYIIMHKESKRSLWILKGLEIIKSWYDFSANLIKGRFALITLASLAGWCVEVLLLKVMATYLLIPFGIGDFAEYIEAIFLRGNSELLNIYVYSGAILFLIAAVILQVVSIMSKGSVRKEQA